jgi:hypothetical protein
MRTDTDFRDVQLRERDDDALMPRLNNAVVCLDPECEVIYPQTLERCPGCGSEGSYLLATWLSNQSLRVDALEAESERLRRNVMNAHLGGVAA